MRQRPAYINEQHAQAILSIAKDCSYEHMHIISEHKDEVFAAADVVVPSIPGSSVSFDAFATGRPVLTANSNRCFSHLYALDLEKEHSIVVNREDELETKLNEILEDRVLWEKVRKKAYYMIANLRKYSAEEALPNMSREICKVAQQLV